MLAGCMRVSGDSDQQALDLQRDELLGAGLDEFQFYTLNRPHLTSAIPHILGVRPRLPRVSPAAA